MSIFMGQQYEQEKGEKPGAKIDSALRYTSSPFAISPTVSGVIVQ